MSQPSWKEAIIKVLAEAKQPLHYQEITEQILTSGIKTTDGATPAATVNAQIAASIKHDKQASPFTRVAKGVFTLRAGSSSKASAVESAEDEDESDSIVRAFAMYWQRELVVWKGQPRLYGRQQVGSKSVDFGGQRGVYVLYDHHTVVYVGRALDRPIGKRLYEHTLDRLSGRWNRFSWFGLLEVTEAGKLLETWPKVTTEAIVATLEALLIETLEPPQNRKRGDDFVAVEYIQDVDPELRERDLQKTLRAIEHKLRDSER